MERGSASLDDVCGSALRLVRSAPGSVVRVRLQQGDAVVEMEWAGNSAVPAAQTTMAPQAQTAMAPQAQTAVAAQAAQAAQAAVADPAAEHPAGYLRAPMIGTFYRSPSPGEPPFVQEGDLVEVGTQVGILEAMKLMNPIEADRAGRIAKVLVADGTPVEYDQPLIALDPVNEPAEDE